MSRRRGVALLLAAAMAVTTLGSVPAGAGSPAASTGASVSGYWLVGEDGGMFAFGQSPFLGSTGAMPLTQPIVGMAATPSGKGYWLVARDGGIFAFGDATFHGSTGSLPLLEPIVGMAPTPSGKGYWLVARDGGLFSFGDATFFGSVAGGRLRQPIVGMAATPSGEGYWLVARDGGIFAFGDAHFFGSTGALTLNEPIVGMAATPTGDGYWFVARDGGIFSFGDATFLGSTGGTVRTQPIVGMAATPSGTGYWLVASDGGIFSFGDATFHGSTGGANLRRPVVGMAAHIGPPGTGGAAPTSLQTPGAPGTTTAPTTAPKAGSGTTAPTTTKPVAAPTAAPTAAPFVPPPAAPVLAPAAPSFAGQPPGHVKGDADTPTVERRLLFDPNVQWVGTFDRPQWDQSWAFNHDATGDESATTAGVFSGISRYGKALRVAFNPKSIVPALRPLASALDIKMGFNKLGSFPGMGIEPMEEAYFRYYVYLPANWEAAGDGKFPGLAGTMDPVNKPLGASGGGEYNPGGWSGRLLWNNELLDLKPSKVIPKTYLYVKSYNGASMDNHKINGRYYGFNEKWTNIDGDKKLVYMQLGEWNMIELHYKMNTPGVENGVFEGWLYNSKYPNGVRGAYSNRVQYRDAAHPGLKINQIQEAHYYGGSYGPHSVQYQYFDDYAISKARIGPRQD